MTGTYDAALDDTIYWPVGNIRGRISMATTGRAITYTPTSVAALESKTGKLKWYYQFTPHDVHDWDAQEPAVLVDSNLYLNSHVSAVTGKPQWLLLCILTGPTGSYC